MYARLLPSLLLVLFCFAAAPSAAMDRADLDPSLQWDFTHIYPDMEAWEADYVRLGEIIDESAALQGKLGESPANVLRYYQLSDEGGQIAYKVYAYVNLQADLDLRDNTMNAYGQRVSALFARWNQATSWFTPELLQIPLDTMKGWLEQNLDLALYRFAIEESYRQQEHVLDAAGERLLSLQSRFNQTPSNVYAMLSTADAKYRTITLTTGEEVEVTSGQYYARLATERNQADREAVWRAYFETYQDKQNSYASIYNAVLQRDWALAQSRGHSSTLEAALDGNAIPTQVVETLIDVTKKGSAPLQRYYELRRRALGTETISVFDGYVSLVPDEKKYEYDDAKKWIVASVVPLGKGYQQKLAHGLDNRWVDVRETPGKRSGAYSMGVYGVHPFVLMNYTDTMNEVFTLAHEMGHAMHSVLAAEKQPFVYSDYTIFVAEVASTLNEGLLLDYLLERSKDPAERVKLLQHAIDQIALTYYRQVCFADFELEAHRMVERGEPITAEVLNELYLRLVKQYYGDGVTFDPLYGLTWARIPHLFRTPYYVYQYATCFASSAKLLEEMRGGTKKQREQAVARYIQLLESGGNDHPVRQLQKAGVDLTDPGTVQAVVDQMGTLVDKLEGELDRMGMIGASR
jgi:oligoendopeptidase F